MHHMRIWQQAMHVSKLRFLDVNQSVTIRIEAAGAVKHADACRLTVQTTGVMCSGTQLPIRPYPGRQSRCHLALQMTCSAGLERD